MLLLFLPEKSVKKGSEVSGFGGEGGGLSPLNSWTGVFFFYRDAITYIITLYLKKNKQITSHTHLNPPHTEIMRKVIKKALI